MILKDSVEKLEQSEVKQVQSGPQESHYVHLLLFLLVVWFCCFMLATLKAERAAARPQTRAALMMVDMLSANA